MTNSIDSLKKKVCVTVFLDELFEEVDDENRGVPIQVSEVLKPNVKISRGNSLRKLSKFEVHETPKIVPVADGKQSKGQPVRRKKKKKQKISKKSNPSLKAEVPKKEFKQEKSGLLDSVFSTSDFESNTILNSPGCSTHEDKNCFLNFSTKTIPIEKSSSRSNSVTVIHYRDKSCGSNGLSETQSTQTYSTNKSTQFEIKDITEIKSDVISAKQAADDSLAWEKTQKQIQMILARTQGGNGENYDRNNDQHYDLRLILEKCEFGNEHLCSKESFVNYNTLTPYVLTDCDESDCQELSDSYTCVFPHAQKKNNFPSFETKQTKKDRRKNVSNVGLYSDFSNCTDISNELFQKESVLCYTMCLNRKEMLLDKLCSFPQAVSKPNRLLSVETLNSKTSFDSQPVIHIEELKETKEVESDPSKQIVTVKTQSENLAAQNPIPVEQKKKNYAEGDTCKSPIPGNALVKFEYKSKERVLEETTSRQLRAMSSSVRIPVKKVSFNSKAQVFKDSSAEDVDEVFIKNDSRNLVDGKAITDVESETVFAESEVSNSDTLIFDVTPHNGSRFLMSETSDKSICVFEYEECIQTSSVLKKINTVEILGKTSISEINNISTEVVLIGENIKCEDLSFEAWQSISSPKASSNGFVLNDINPCYLKDSKNNAMYLIEVPLRFTKDKKNRPGSRSP